MSTYFPPLDVLTDVLGLPKDALSGSMTRAPRQEYVRLTALRHLVSRALENVEIDPEIYRAQNPDLAASNLKADELIRHYREQGYFEGRAMPIAGFDEAYYLATNPDVEVALRDGDFAGAFEHFQRCGLLEGRSPNAQSGSDTHRWRVLRAGAEATAGRAGPELQIVSG